MPYSDKFAAVYDRLWKGFSESLAPELEIILRRHVEEHDLDLQLADLCCGTGQFIAYLSTAGWSLTGVDQSSAMLSYASKHSGDQVRSGKVRLEECSIENWVPESRYSCITCLFDSMNHLSGMDSIAMAIRVAYLALADSGMLVFDLNTRKGFRRWNAVSFTDDGDTVIFNRGIYSDSMPFAITKITGFTKNSDETFERFDDTVQEVVVGMDEVRKCLKDTGFRNIRIANRAELPGSCEDPESLTRAFFFAMK
jgi:SAM-dependent methyltransferase